MIFTFGKYTLDIDVERTTQFYQESAQELTEGCDCPGCRNFLKASDGFLPEVKVFFTQLGVNILQAPDISAYNGNIEKQTLYYEGFCHLCGTILMGGDIWIEETPNQFRIDESNWYQVAEGCRVAFSDRCGLMEKGFPTPTIQMEVCMDVPWVLEEERHSLLT